jgi:nucleotide-binding universal stress UspA family protein
MAKDPWTDADPQHGNFDAELALLDASMAERHAGNPDARLRVLVSVDGADAARLARIAEARAKTPGEVVAELLRDAERWSG